MALAGLKRVQHRDNYGRELSLLVHPVKRSARHWLPALDIHSAAEALLAEISMISRELDAFMSRVSSAFSDSLSVEQQDVTGMDIEVNKYMTAVLATYEHLISLAQQCAARATGQAIPTSDMETVKDTAEDRGIFYKGLSVHADMSSRATKKCPCISSPNTHSCQARGTRRG